MRIKRIKIGLLALALFIIATTIGFFIYVSQYYKADDVAIAAIQNAPSVEYHNNYMAFAPSTPTDKALIFYPGGKVEHLAYFPLLESLSQNGITCILVEMPFHLAVFNANAANEIMLDFPAIKQWYIGGHSLGGAMASSYASANPDKVDGLILLGAYVYGDYPKEKAITIYGSNDTVLNQSKIDYIENVFMIDGGNHAQFGNYGPQTGDSDATISQEEQQNIAEQYIVDFMKQGDRYDDSN